MGSLSSPPKSPAQQIVYVPAPASTSSSISTPSSSENGDDASAKSRKQGLLSRNRGRFGTIATSLQGVLSNKTSQERKALLGE